MEKGIAQLRDSLYSKNIAQFERDADALTTSDLTRVLVHVGTLYTKSTISRLINLCDDEQWMLLLKRLLQRLTEDESQRVIMQPDQGGKNAVHKSIEIGQLLATKMLLDLLSSENREKVIAHCDNMGCNTIHLSIDFGRMELLRMLLEMIPDDNKLLLISQVDYARKNAVYKAVEQGDDAILGILLSSITLNKHLNILEEISVAGYNALHLAVGQARERMVISLLHSLSKEQEKEMLKQRDTFGRNTLHLAINKHATEASTQKNERFGILGMLMGRMGVEQKIELIIQQDNAGNNAIHMAVQQGNVQLLKMMLELLPLDQRQDEIKQLNKNRYSSIHSAIQLSHEVIFLTLLKVLPARQQQEVFMQQTADGNTALHLAAGCATERMLSNILDTFSKDKRWELMNKQDKSSRNVVHVAIICNRETSKKLHLLHILMAKLTLEKQQELIMQRDVDGNNTVHLAVQHKSEDLVIKLVKILTPTQQQSAINETNKLGYSPVQYAERLPEKEIYCKLLKTQKSVEECKKVRSAVESNDEGTVKDELEVQAQVHHLEIITQKCPEGYNIIRLAAEKDNNGDMIKALLSGLTSDSLFKVINQESSDGNDLIVLAIKYHDEGLLKFLLQQLHGKQKEELILRKYNGYNAVDWAVKFECDFALDILLDILPLKKQQEMILQEANEGEDLISIVVGDRIDILLEIVQELLPAEQHLLDLCQIKREKMEVELLGSRKEMLESLVRKLTPEKQTSALASYLCRWAVASNKTDILKLSLNMLSKEQSLKLIVKQDYSRRNFLHRAVAQKNITMLQILLEEIPRESRILMLMSQNGEGYDVVKMAAINCNYPMLEEILNEYTPEEIAKLVMQQNPHGSNALYLAEELWDPKEPSLLSYISENKLSSVVLLLLQQGVRENSNRLLKLLCEQNRVQVAENISELSKTENLTRDQIDIFSTLSRSYIIPCSQKMVARYAFIFYKKVGREEFIEEAAHLKQAMCSAGFHTKSVKWENFYQLTIDIANKLKEIAAICSLVWIVFIGDGEVSQLLNVTKKSLECHQHIPVIFLLHTPPTNQTDPEEPPAKAARLDMKTAVTLNRLHSVLLQSTFSSARVGKRSDYINSLANEIRHADGVKDIYAMHQSAIFKSSKEVASDIPEYSDKLVKVLALPLADNIDDAGQSHETFVADNEESADDESSEKGLDFYTGCQEEGIFESIPPNVLDSLEQLCRKYSVEFATFEQDPNDSKHILILGVDAEKIPEEEVLKALPDASFKVRRQNSDGPLHTTMLSMEYALSIEKKEWENDEWTRIEKASCQLLVKAKEKNKDNPNENGSSFAIGPAHLVLKNKQARVVLARVDQSQVAREEVERLTTSNRYIIKVGDTETDLFDFNYPVLLSYRYWCRVTKGAKCDSCLQLSRGERPEISFCRHMIMNDMVLLPLERPSTESLQAQLANELGFTVGPIFPIINIGQLKEMEKCCTPIWVGNVRGKLRPCNISNSKTGDFIGYHLKFCVTSKDAQGVTHVLEKGDCGRIVFCRKDKEKEYRPLGMFIGKSTAKFDAPLYQAILLDEAIKDIEKEYPHHVEEIKLY